MSDAYQIFHLHTVILSVQYSFSITQISIPHIVPYTLEISIILKAQISSIILSGNIFQIGKLNIKVLLIKLGNLIYSDLNNDLEPLQVKFH